MQEFLEAIKLRHDYAAAEFSLGVTYKMRNQLQDARRPSGEGGQAAAEDGRRARQPRHDLLPDGQGRRRRSRELDKAVEINPNDATWQSSLGEIYREKKDYGKAIPHLEQAVMLDPKDARALSNLGVAYRQTNKIAEAREVFPEGARAQARRRPTSHFNLGVVYRRKK